MPAMSRLRSLLLALTLGSCCAPGIAAAQCSFSAGPNALAFGAYDPGAATPADSSCTFTYACSSGSYKPFIQLSTGASGSFAQRFMTGSGGQLGYNLYSDAARTAIWGDSPTGLYQYVLGRPKGGSHGETLTIYGRILAGQWVRPGSYADSITVTLNF
jgi:spore coat protein U-like protein